jgi:pilus assembly protein Flp/PilA
MSTDAVLTSPAQDHASRITAWCASRSLLRARGLGALARSARHTHQRTARMSQISLRWVPGNSEGCWPFHACAICAPPTCAPSSSLSTAALSLPMKEIVMERLTTTLKQFVRDEDGVTAIEYGLIAALIAVVIIASVKLVGQNLSTVFSYIAAELG